MSIFVHEIEYEKTNTRNRQERHLKLPSWECYKSCLLDGKNSRPNINAPNTFRLIEKDNKIVYGTFVMKDKEYAHIASVIEKDKIPYSAYIIEVEIIDE